MKLYKTILFGENQKVEFGIPNTDAEIKKMFELRFKVYVKEKKYVADSDDYMADADKHDKNGRSTYFIASINNEVVGTARIIREDITPTETDYFDFEKPKVLDEISSEKIVDTHIHPPDVMGVVHYTETVDSYHYENFLKQGLLEFFNYGKIEKIGSRIYFKLFPDSVVRMIKDTYREVNEDRIINKRASL